MGAAVSRIGTYSDISETVPRQQSPLLQKSCICHRLSFLGATLSTSYRWKLYEPRIVPWNAVARDCCSKKIAKIYLYDPFEIPLLREITATRVSNIQISSSLLLPFSFLLFFFQTHHWEGNRKIFLSLSRINVIIPVDFHSFGGIFGSISPPIIRSSHRENAHQREEWISASRASLPTLLHPLHLYFSTVSIDEADSWTRGKQTVECKHGYIRERAARGKAWCING